MDIEKRDIMEGLLRGLAVVEAFNEARHRLTPGEAAQIAGISRAAARRCLLTLVAGGYATFDGKFFSLTPKAVGLGRAYLAMTPLAASLQPYVRTIAEQFSEPCTAAILDEEHVIYIARSQPDRMMTVNFGIGSRLPAYCTSLGRAMLAFQDPEWLDRYWSKAKLEPRTPYTLIDREKIEEKLAEIRECGFALIEQEVEVGLRSLGVPLWGADRRVRAALTVTASIHSKSSEDLQRDVLPELLKVQQSVRHLNGTL